jgi:hypothetical protein
MTYLPESGYFGYCNTYFGGYSLRSDGVAGQTAVVYWKDNVFILQQKILEFAGFLQESYVYDIACSRSFCEHQAVTRTGHHCIGRGWQLHHTVEHDQGCCRGRGAI